MTARLPPSSPAASSTASASRADRMLAELASLPVEELERLAARLTPAALRRRRLAERDEALRLMAEAGPMLASGRAVAQEIARTVARYAATGWRQERGKPAPTSWRRALAHRVLSLNDGRAPGVRTIEDALAHIGNGGGLG